MAGDDGRGHLGKQLTRKAESNLLLKKEEDVTVITSEKQRKAPITAADGVAFKWSNGKGMHVSCASPLLSEREAKTSELRDIADAAFGVERLLRRCDLEAKIADLEGCKGSTPYRRVTQMLKMGVIRRSEFGRYERIA